MKIVVTGAAGQVGSAVVRLARQAGFDVIPLSHHELDIGDEVAVCTAVKKIRPTHIINAAAYNAVDRAEDEEVRAFRVNASGPGFLAAAARYADAILVHYSSDYVFDGTKTTAYTEDDTPRPLSVYAHSKLAGEAAVQGRHPHSYILRVAWVFAPGGDNFVSRLLARAARGEPLHFINDRWCTPTYADDIARATLALLTRHAPFGIYHAVGSEIFTPFSWAQTIVTSAQLSVPVTAVASSAFFEKAKRPVRSILTNRKLSALGIDIPSARTRLADYFAVTERRTI